MAAIDKAVITWGRICHSDQRASVQGADGPCSISRQESHLGCNTLADRSPEDHLKVDRPICHCMYVPAWSGPLHSEPECMQWMTRPAASPPALTGSYRLLHAG